MSKLFYDGIVDLSEVERSIKKNIKDKETQEELFHLIDEMVHHRVVGCILDRLPKDHHEEFVNRIVDRPHDESIINFLKERIIDDVEAFIREESAVLSQELMVMLSDKPSKKNLKKKSK